MSEDCGYADTHYLIEERVPPTSVIELRKELQKPEHADICREAVKGRDFEECIATIAYMLDIALDGTYDVQPLCEVLVQALRSRFVSGNQPWRSDSRLVSCELVEREGTITLEKGSATGTIAPILAAPLVTASSAREPISQDAEVVCKRGGDENGEAD